MDPSIHALARESRARKEVTRAAFVYLSNDI
jgi:hypothetical protein